MNTTICVGRYIVHIHTEVYSLQSSIYLGCKRTKRMGDRVGERERGKGNLKQRRDRRKYFLSLHLTLKRDGKLFVRMSDAPCCNLVYLCLTCLLAPVIFVSTFIISTFFLEKYRCTRILSIETSFSQKRWNLQELCYFRKIWSFQ